MIKKKKVGKKVVKVITPPTKFNGLCQSLVDCFGTQTKAAEKLGLTQPNFNDCIHNRSRASMPAIPAMNAEIETNGRFKCESLCPELAEIMPLARKIEVMRGAKS